MKRRARNPVLRLRRLAAAALVAAAAPPGAALMAGADEAPAEAVAAPEAPAAPEAVAAPEAPAAPAAVAAPEAPAAPMDGATLYAQRTCIACHGPDAKTPILPEYPKLAGQNELYLLQQMRDIKGGARTNGNTAAMSGVMHLVTDEELVVLARWLSEKQP